MNQRLQTPDEQRIVGPHIRHPDPHEQYLTKALGATKEDLNAAMDEAGPVTSNDVPTIIGIADSGEVGTSAESARSDHQHESPPLATIYVDGFLSAIDKTKLDGQGFNAVLSPLDGGVLDIDNGTLVWDIDNLQQVVAA
jgi:hypothetical protein